MAGAAADAREAALAARYAAGTPVLASGAAADARDAALAAWPAARTTVLASGSAVAVVIAATATWVLLEDNVGGRGSGRRWASHEGISCGRRRDGDRRSNNSSHYQWFHKV